MFTRNYNLIKKSKVIDSKKYIKIFKSIYENGKNNYNIWWYWNRKTKIYQLKRPIPIKNIDINKVVVSKKISFGKMCFKYFIDYKDAKRIRPLCIFLPKNECI